MRHAEFSWYPDRTIDEQASAAAGETVYRADLWSYFQSPGAIWWPADEDRPAGTFAWYGDGARGTVGSVPGSPESDWVCIYPPGGEGEWHRMIGGRVSSGECGMFKACRTPASWPADRRWILCNSASESWGDAYRIKIGISIAPDIAGPWASKVGGITSLRIAPVPPAHPEWPPGVWSVSCVTIGGKVYVIGYDPGVSNADYVAGRQHVVHELHPDLTSTYVGRILFDTARKPAANTEYTWARDVAIAADGRLYELDGGDPGTAKIRRDVREYATTAAWVPGAETVVKATGRVWSHPAAPAVNTWDCGYVRTPEGGLAEPLGVISNAGANTNAWWIRSRTGCWRDGELTDRRGWWLQVWDDSPDARWIGYLQRDARRPAVGDPPHLLAEWGGDPDLMLDIWALGPTWVEWEGHRHALEPLGGVQCLRVASLWPEYTAAPYRAAQAAGEVVVTVTVRGQWCGHARIDAPGGGVVYPQRVSGRWA